MSHRRQLHRRPAVATETQRTERIERTAEQTVWELARQIGILESRYERALRAEGFTERVMRAGTILSSLTAQRAALLSELGTPMQGGNPHAS